MDLYTEDLISREELKERLTKLRIELEQVEEALALAAYEEGQEEGLAQCIGQCFSGLSDIARMDDMTNAQLRQLIERIEVSKDGSVDIYLSSFEGFCRKETVPLRHIGT
jgi:DNA-binding transcriptional MerR regulator